VVFEAVRGEDVMYSSMRGVGLVGNRDLFSWMGGWFGLG